jgi:hypothetical protein
MMQLLGPVSLKMKMGKLSHHVTWLHSHDKHFSYLSNASSRAWKSISMMGAGYHMARIAVDVLSNLWFLILICALTSSFTRSNCSWFPFLGIPKRQMNGQSASTHLAKSQHLTRNCPHFRRNTSRSDAKILNSCEWVHSTE